MRDRRRRSCAAGRDRPASGAACTAAGAARLRLRRSRPRRADAGAESVAIENLAQTRQLERLREHRIHAGGRAALHLVRHRAGGERDDRHALARRSSRARISRVAARPSITGICTSMSTSLNSSWKYSSTPRLPFSAMTHFAAEPLQEALRHLLIDDVVFDHQHLAVVLALALIRRERGAGDEPLMTARGRIELAFQHALDARAQLCAANGLGHVSGEARAREAARRSPDDPSK